MARETSDAEKNRQLEETLKESFPASDPSSSNTVDDKPVRPIDRRPAYIDKELVDRLARQVARSVQEK